MATTHQEHGRDGRWTRLPAWASSVLMAVLGVVSLTAFSLGILQETDNGWVLAAVGVGAIIAGAAGTLLEYLSLQRRKRRVQRWRQTWREYAPIFQQLSTVLAAEHELNDQQLDVAWRFVQEFRQFLHDAGPDQLPQQRREGLFEQIRDVDKLLEDLGTHSRSFQDEEVKDYAGRLAYQGGMLQRLLDGHEAPGTSS
jgi:hypothetical protein